jgi:hypothetical protein
MTLQESYKDEIWNDKSNIYCYIVFKTILLYNLNNFFKIYTYPYDTDIITKYIIDNSKYIDLSKKVSLKNNELTFVLNAKSSSFVK